MNKLFLTACAVVWAGNVYASDLRLPVGKCLLSIPEQGWCGLLTVQSNQQMQYIAGNCNSGRMEIKYRARSIRRHGNEITIDGTYHITVTWLSPLGTRANVTYRFADKYGDEHTGTRSLACE